MKENGTTDRVTAAICTIAELKAAARYYANDNPKYWHLYKHAKKARTRKKYQRRLMKHLLRTLATGSAGREVSA